MKRKRRRKKKDRGDGSAFKKKDEYENDYHAKNNGEEREDENEDEDDDEDEEYEGDELIWTATKTMRWDEPLEYRYAVVDSHGSVILWDAPIRIAKLERQTSQSLELIGGGGGGG